MTTVRDRRMFSRVEVGLPISLPGAFLRDICASGARVTCQRRFLLDEDIVFLVNIPDGKAPLSMKGKAVWSKETGINVWDTGLRFEKINFMDLHRLFNM
ncbi:MAG: PilZ domain-containing protein [Candidatus Omnitrophota bacterium]